MCNRIYLGQTSSKSCPSNLFPALVISENRATWQSCCQMGVFIFISGRLSMKWKWKKVKVKLLSRVRLLATPWTVAYQAPPSMGFSRQEYWSGLPFPSPGDLPDPGIELRSPAFQADTLTSEPPGKSKIKYISPFFIMVILYWFDDYISYLYEVSVLLVTKEDWSLKLC